MQLKVKKHELRLLLQCIPILTFATLASLGSLLPSVVQFSAAVILAGQVVFIFGTKGIKKNIGLLWIPLMIFFYVRNNPNIKFYSLKKGIDFVIKKYGTVPMKTKVKNKLLKILRGGGTN